MTRRTLRLLAGFGTCISLAGCLPPSATRPVAADSPAIDPVAFFTGRTHGEGVLESRFASRRPLTVDGHGYQNADGSFTLDQTIAYADGAAESRKWVLRRRSATSYTATLSDADGEVSAEATGNLFHLRYRIRQPHVYMEQWLYLQPDGHSVINVAQVNVLGIPWAKLSETITQVRP